MPDFRITQIDPGLEPELEHLPGPPVQPSSRLKEDTRPSALRAAAVERARGVAADEHGVDIAGLSDLGLARLSAAVSAEQLRRAGAVAQQPVAENDPVNDEELDEFEREMLESDGEETAEQLHARLSIEDSDVDPLEDEVDQQLREEIQRREAAGEEVNQVTEREKPFGCPHCEFTAGSAVGLKTHVRVKHAG